MTTSDEGAPLHQTYPIPVISNDAAMGSGREWLGVPKKIAEITLDRVNDQAASATYFCFAEGDLLPAVAVATTTPQTGDLSGALK